MIPLLVVARIGRAGRRGLPIWIPLFLIWLLLAPLALLLLPLFVIGCRVLRVRPFLALSVGWQLLCGLRRTHIEVATPAASVALRFL